MRRLRAVVVLVLVAGAMVLPADGALAEPPPNDLFADSVVIDPASLPFADSVDTTEATSDDDDTALGCPAPATDASVWYSITPAIDMLLEVGADDSDYSWGISVATGDSGSFELIECRPFAFLVDAQAGVTYHFQVFDDRSDGGDNGGRLEFTLEESTAAAERAEGDALDDPVVIETQLTFETEPDSGTFEVIAGADILGCSSGTFEDPEAEPGADGQLEVTKVLTCESGPNTGTISVLFRPGEDIDEPDLQTGPWEVKEGTEDFAGLVGGGDFSVVFDSTDTGTETLAGSVEFSGSDGQLAETGSETTVIALFGVFLLSAGAVVLRLRPRPPTHS